MVFKEFFKDDALWIFAGSGLEFKISDKALSPENTEFGVVDEEQASVWGPMFSGWGVYKKEVEEVLRTKPWSDL